MVVAPPGVGKSRIAIATAFLMDTDDAITQICFVFANKHLRSVEEEGIQSLKRTGLLKKEVKVIVADKPKDFAIDEAATTLFIVDEADYFYFDLLAYPKQGKVLGLTATSVGSNNMSELEFLLFGLDLQIIECGFVTLDVYDVTTVSSVHEFLQKAKGMPKLVYGQPILGSELPGHEQDLTEYPLITKMQTSQTLLPT